jgi:hypothetical protein
MSDELVGLTADERLLAAPAGELPTALGRPAELPELHRRARIVGAGATMTAITLIGGVVLAVLGAVELLFEGGGALAVVLLVAGLLLAGTHWGWVHVAEATADSLQRQAGAPVLDERRAWLSAIAPYTRYEVVTSAQPDGSIAIERLRFVPVRTADETFLFVRERELRELHGADEPAAAVAERAEALRHQAAVDTERDRTAWAQRAEAAADAQLAHSDEADRRRAAAAAARALSDQLNANLREPPLTE